MATFKGAENPLKQCPYNPDHWVSCTKFMGHIVKCARNPSTPYLLECPFYASHRIPKEKYIEHITSECTHREQALVKEYVDAFLANQWKPPKTDKDDLPKDGMKDEDWEFS